jgi:hypothetical protein
LTATSPTTDGGAPPERQTLAERLRRGPLALSVGLGYAAQIARELRDLHAHGDSHGHIAASGVLLSGEGASLAPSLHYAGATFAQRDVQCWGLLLQELVGGAAAVDPGVSEDSRKGPDSVLPAARRLVRKCQGRPPEPLLTMQQAYNEVRMLAMLAKQYRLDRESIPPVSERPGRSFGLNRLGPAMERPATDSAPAERGPHPGERAPRFSFRRKR